MKKNILVKEMKNIIKSLFVGVLLCLCGTALQAQNNKVKVGEFDYSQYNRIEDRVYFLNELQEKGFIIEAGEKDGIVDIYAASTELRDVNDDDIDNYFAALEQINQDWQVFAPLERKGERVTYYAMNYSHLDNAVFFKIDADFNRGTRETENPTCQTALPFCTDNGQYHFYPGVNSGSPCGNATTSSCSAPINCSTMNNSHHSYYGISTAPNPAFYYMRIAEPGNLDIYMTGCSTPGGTPDIDIDFVLWGPFESLDDACVLSCSNMVDASYSAAPTEHCYIDNAQTGQFYMLLITNYGNDPGEFSFANQGSGTTDCSIMEPGVSCNGPICIGQTLELSAVAYSGADSFFWQGPNGWTSTQQNPTRPNATVAMSGTYTCTITKDGETAVSELEVVILPNPIAKFNSDPVISSSTSVICQGTTINFSNASTTSPAGGEVTEFLWEIVSGTTTVQSSTQSNFSYTFNTTGLFKLKFTAGNGVCSNTVTKNIYVEAAKTREETAEACATYTWYGETYNESGDYTHNVPNTQGCDSIITLHLTIYNAETTDVYQTSCDSYEWHGTTYTTSGNYTYSAGGTDCAEIEVLHLTINDSQYPEETVTACNSYQWNGMTYTESGTYSHEGTTQQGCTLIQTLYLTINESTTSSTDVTECDSYSWNGTNYTQSGVYTYNTTNAHGCDSVATLNLTINYSETEEETQSACDSYIWHGQEYTVTDNYLYETVTEQGCPHTEILHLTIGHSEYPEETVTACDSYQWNGMNLTQSDTYTFETTTEIGCPKLETLYLTINNSDASTTAITECDSYIWNGQEYTQSGSYTYNTQTVLGCDSVATLNLTINYSEAVEEAQTSCETYTWHEQEYINSGDYTFNTTTAQGCPRTETLHLTIGYPEYPEETVTACDSYEWNGQTYTTSNTYTYETTTDLGCYKLETLYLTVNYSDESMSEASECDNYVWNGVNYTTSGIYEYHTQTALGCDSVARLDLTIQYSEYSTEDLVACNNYNWHDVEYTTSGTYEYEIPTSFGCPHHEVLNLTIVETPDVTVDGSRWPVSGSETNISIYNYSVVPQNTATEFDSVTWQLDAPGWYVVPNGNGETADLRIYSWLADSILMTVTAYNQCGSMTTSFWIHPSYYGVEENMNNNISILPNPNKGSMDIRLDEASSSDVEIKVFDLLGNIVDEFSINRYTNLYHYDMSSRAKGLYNFVITNGENTITKRVIVE